MNRYFCLRLSCQENKILPKNACVALPKGLYRRSIKVVVLVTAPLTLMLQHYNFRRLEIRKKAKFHKFVSFLPTLTLMSDSSEAFNSSSRRTAVNLLPNVREHYVLLNFRVIRVNIPLEIACFYGI